MRDDNTIKMPPTKRSLTLLFRKLNLYVPSMKIVDCMVFCRGKEMEDADPDDFDINKLVQWFELNVRALHHIDDHVI